MYQKKNIRYKSIFKQDGQSETIEYKGTGVLCHGETSHLNFEADGMTIDIGYNERGVTLKHGRSVLKFSFEKEVWNEYQLPYGQAILKTKLLKFVVHDEHIQMKYELYDQTGLISTVYIYISM